MARKIKVLSVKPSTTVEDVPGAVDAVVIVDGIRGEVTLLPRQSDGVLDSWGSSVDFWAQHSLHHLTRETLDEVVAAVRAQAVKGGK